MPNSQQEVAGYTIRLRGMALECANIARVVEAVKVLGAMTTTVPQEREIALSASAEPELDAGNPVAREVYAVFRDAPTWRRPVEIVRALRKRGVPRGEATYNKVYAVLRYGDFVRKDGRWNVADAA